MIFVAPKLNREVSESRNGLSTKVEDLAGGNVDKN